MAAKAKVEETEETKETRVKVEITNRRESDLTKVYVGCIVNGKFLSERFEVAQEVEMFPSQIKSLEARTENVRVVNKKSKTSGLARKPIYTISKV